MNLLPNKRDAYPKPIVDTRISASEWNQLVGSCMAFITEAGFTPDASDNEQFLNAFKAIAASLELIGANTNLSNLTATGEAKFDAKVNLDGSNATFPHITETYSSGTDWYRVWSDGWCEQGGRVYNNAEISNTINLLKPYIDTNYTVLINHGVSGAYYINIYGAHTDEPYDFTATSFKACTYPAAGLNNIQWRACGYIS